MLDELGVLIDPPELTDESIPDCCYYAVVSSRSLYVLVVLHTFQFSLHFFVKRLHALAVVELNHEVVLEQFVDGADGCVSGEEIMLGESFDHGQIIRLI